MTHTADVANSPLMAVFVIAVGMALLAFAGAVGWGVFGRGTQWLERLRWVSFDSSIASAFLLSPARLLALQQFFGLAFVLVGLAQLVPRQPRIFVDVLMLPAIGSIALGFIGVIWPRPFVSKWVRQAERNRRAGIPATTYQPRPARPMSSRQRRLGFAVLGFALFSNLAIGGPLSVTSALIMGLGIFMAMSAQKGG